MGYASEAGNFGLFIGSEFDLRASLWHVSLQSADYMVPRLPSTAPGHHHPAEVAGNPDEDDAYFYYSSFTETPQIYKTSIASGKTTLWEKVVIPVEHHGG